MHTAVPHAPHVPPAGQGVGVVVVARVPQTKVPFTAMRLKPGQQVAFGNAQTGGGQFEVCVVDPLNFNKRFLAHRCVLVSL